MELVVVVVEVLVMEKVLVLVLELALLAAAAAVEGAGGYTHYLVGTGQLHNQGHEHHHNTHHLICKTNMMDNKDSHHRQDILREIPREAEAPVGAQVQGEVVEGRPPHRVHIRGHHNPNVGPLRSNHGWLGNTKHLPRKVQFPGNHQIHKSSVLISETLLRCLMFCGTLLQVPMLKEQLCFGIFQES